jgi:hypothetical protein
MISKSRTTKLVSGFVSFAMAISFAIPVMASAATVAELQA